jgi:hypothetical protein
MQESERCQKNDSMAATFDGLLSFNHVSGISSPFFGEEAPIATLKKDRPIAVRCSGTNGSSTRGHRTVAPTFPDVIQYSVFGIVMVFFLS